MRVYDNGIDAHRKGLANECGIVRVASRLRSGDRECRQGFISAVPLAAEDILAMLAVARASGHRSGAALRRVELPTRMTHSFGKNFHNVAVSSAEGTDVLKLFFARENAELHAAG